MLPYLSHYLTSNQAEDFATDLTLLMVDSKLYKMHAIARILHNRQYPYTVQLQGMFTVFITSSFHQNTTKGIQGITVCKV